MLMMKCFNVYCLNILFISVGLEKHMGTVTARLNKPIQLASVNWTVCNVSQYTVEWYSPGHKLCTIMNGAFNGSRPVGDCQSKAQFHCQNNSLVLNTVTSKDVGDYMEKIICQSNGDINVINITLRIISPPQITNLSINSTQSALIITCEVGGENVSSTWLKDGQALPQNDQQVLQNMNRTLMVHEPTGRDCGKYTCLASGDGGNAEAHVNINGDYPICTKDQHEAQGKEIAIITSSAVICVLALIIVGVCIKRYHSGICFCASETTEDTGKDKQKTSICCSHNFCKHTFTLS
ncbi:hypothetical protein ACEWY4_009550 [Coilia grayii]|uniref:Ig-like domain-containing protein n=1 Tax=Coilia grayii TaxID=363190 RepID=A0ABD1K711_9TELE